MRTFVECSTADKSSCQSDITIRVTTKLQVIYTSACHRRLARQSDVVTAIARIKREFKMVMKSLSLENTFYNNKSAEAIGDSW